ncbi:hypothetical protein, partial [Streptomyces kronopolitis]
AAGAGARGQLPGLASRSMTATFKASLPYHRQLLDQASEMMLRAVVDDPVSHRRCTADRQHGLALA